LVIVAPASHKIPIDNRRNLPTEFYRQTGRQIERVSQLRPRDRLVSSQ
jgi:hypothetical protein